MRPVEIGLDMDDTICHLKPYWIGRINERHGLDFDHLSISGWDLKPFFPMLSPKDIYGFLEEPGFFRGLAPMPGALEAIERFIEAGHNVSILTTCSHGHRDKIEWLQEHVKSFRKLDIYTCNRNKYRVQFDYFVDDHPGNLIPYQEFNPKSEVLCMAQSHNAHYTGLRFHDWESLEMHINARISMKFHGMDAHEE